MLLLELLITPVVVCYVFVYALVRIADKPTPKPTRRKQ
jgi:hypothetical protein